MPSGRVSLFTIIMEYRGGTYIAQVAATRPETALKDWARQINPIDIAHFGESRKAELIKCIDEWLGERGTAVAITGTVNVWCYTETIGGSLMLINLVATERVVFGARLKRKPPRRVS
jgi:hypothetical protein